MPRPVILGLAFILLAAGALGLMLGLRMARLDESRLIEQAAAAYVAQGGVAEDCVARPGTGRIWIVVTCGEGAGAQVAAFNRWGFEIAPYSAPGT